MKELTYEEAINSNRTFYAKRWQQNDFYPIYKFVYHPDKDAYEQFEDKGSSGWHSWGIDWCGVKDAKFTNKEWWLSIFKMNPYKFSFQPMKDDHHYNTD